MRVSLLPLLSLLLLGACSGPRGQAGDAPPPPPPPPPPAADAAAPVAEPPPPPPPVSPDAAPPAKAGCQADMNHCCLPDGRITVMGPCQPVYRAGDPPAVTRNPDGTCKPRQCTVRCLPPGARIATPHGEVAISSLAAGDLVWTLDGAGRRVAAPLLRVQSVSAPAHLLLEVTLDDGRSLRASAGHPLPNGRPLATLAAGDAVDGARVAGVRTVALDGEHTFDLLPAGETGLYFADGVLLASTLAFAP